MFRRLILIILLLLNGLCFAYTKQDDEYSCGVFSCYNLIEKSCVKCKNYEPEELRVLLKTDKNGTTAQNLCDGLKQYFNSQNKIADVRYYGIKKVSNYKIDNNIDLLKLKTLIDNGYYAILNIGVYRKDKNFYNRVYGHYVNLISIKKNKLQIFDPYDKNKKFINWNFQTTNAQINNINDNEEYENISEYIKINTPISYLEKNEIALVNGVILVKYFDINVTGDN